MLRACVLEFQGKWEDDLPLVEFSYNNSYQSTIKMAPFEALYGRKCRTPLCWSDLDEALIIGPEMIQETTEIIRNIREHIRVAQSRQKSYANKRRRSLEFQVNDKVFLKASPTRGVRFRVRGKLSPRYIGPYEIIEMLNTITYRLDLLVELEHMHNVFYISQLRKYIPDPDHTIVSEPIETTEDLVYEERPIQILDRRIKQLCNKQIPLIKVLWTNHTSQEATWETEEAITTKYPHLFVVILHVMIKFISFEDETF